MHMEVATVEQEYTAARTGSVMIDASAWGRLKFTGKNRVDFLNRMSTNTCCSASAGNGQSHDADRAHADRTVVFVHADDADADLTRHQFSRGAAAAQHIFLTTTYRSGDDRRDGDDLALRCDGESGYRARDRRDYPRYHCTGAAQVAEP
jgi:hypothetical protein